MSERVVNAYAPCIGEPLSWGICAAAAKRGTVVLLRRDAGVRDSPLLGLERETYRTLDAKMRASRGFFCLPGPHGPLRGIGEQPPEWPVHERWSLGISRIAEVCQRRGIRLLILFSPVHPDYRDARDWSQLDRWASELAASHPGASVARPVVASYEPRFMWDAIHLNAAGVARFMPVVARDVQQALDRDAEGDPGRQQHGDAQQ